MSDSVPLYVVGLSTDEPAGELLRSTFASSLDKVHKVLSNIIEAKITVKSQNTDGTRTHYDVTATVKTSNDHLVYTDSGWDIPKIASELSRKLEGEMPKHNDQRQKESIRKRDSGNTEDVC